MARRVDAAAAKQARQKKIAIGGFVLLAGVLAITGPKTLKQLKGPQAPPVSAAVAPAPAASPTPETDAVAPLAAAELIDTGGVPQPAEDQLISFEQFDGKDPFAQQVGQLSADSAAAAPAAAPAAGAPAPANEPVVESVPLPPPPPSVTAPILPVPAPTQPTIQAEPTPAPAPAPKPTSAVLSINGVRETVAVEGRFPAADKVFELRSLGVNEVKVGIADGTLTGSSQTVTLKKGKKVTLVNTADGTRYELVLVSLA